MRFNKLISVLTLLSVASIGGQAFARHSPLDGKLQVSNDRSEGGRIFVDGEFRVFVPAGSSRQISNVPNGVRLIFINQEGIQLRTGVWVTMRFNKTGNEDRSVSFQEDFVFFAGPTQDNLSQPALCGEVEGQCRGAGDPVDL